VVISVYSAHLTVAGEASLRSLTHLEPFPKTLTSPVRNQVRALLAGRGVYEPGRFRTARKRRATAPEFPHLKNFSDFFPTLHGRADLAIWPPAMDRGDSVFLCFAALQTGKVTDRDRDRRMRCWRLAGASSRNRAHGKRLRSRQRTGSVRPCAAGAGGHLSSRARGNLSAAIARVNESNRPGLSMKPYSQKPHRIPKRCEPMHCTVTDIATDAPAAKNYSSCSRQDSQFIPLARDQQSLFCRIPRKSSP
jgi:hypothetical protein